MKKIILPLLFASLFIIGCVDKKKTTEEAENAELIKEIETLETTTEKVEEVKNEIKESAEKLDAALEGIE